MLKHLRKRFILINQFYSSLIIFFCTSVLNLDLDGTQTIYQYGFVWRVMEEQ